MWWRSLYDALAAELMPPGCVSCMPAAGDVARLGDSIKFAEVAQRAGLAVPPFVPITSRGQLYSYNRCKACGKNNTSLGISLLQGLLAALEVEFPSDGTGRLKRISQRAYPLKVQNLEQIAPGVKR